ncbi:LysR substrate-binding domain-containing protein [Thalassobius sp. Cn5-15]|uniref:LysR family transcriptional regulator n=1 Tax=Thalassobius sp. Cn5-15 TaxID=2917763 RepID=UPI001EF3C694|nr:LysR substrate-binding domain-containing protein [Thalassobius sp. Cn5-15]MCG7492780.1 LysR substrate-binding domain-containing protein [Thalassobius sp. Cn5-15]
MCYVLDHRLLRHFVAVAHAGGLRAGASALNMSQPPLSRTISELEAGLGVAVFERSKSGVSLTDAGRILLEEAEDILAALDRAEARVSRMGRQARPLRVGFVSAALDAHLPDLLSRIAGKGWPAPQLIEVSSDPLAKAIARAELDLGFLHPPVDVAAGLTIAPLGEEGFCVALRKGHPLSECDSIRTSDLTKYPLVLFPKSQGPVLHAAIKGAIAPDSDLEVAAEAARSHTQLALVAAGAGIGLIGDSVGRTISYDGVVTRRWTDRPKAVALQNAILGADALMADLGYI